MPPRNDGEGVPPRIDGEGVPPRNDGEGVPPRNDGEGLPPRNDGESVPPSNDGENDIFVIEADNWKSLRPVTLSAPGMQKCYEGGKRPSCF